VSFSTYKLFLLILTGSTLSFADVDPSLSVIGSFDPGSPVSLNYRNAPEFTGTPSGGSSTPDNLGTFSLPTLPQGADPFHGDFSALLLDVWPPPSNVRNGTSPPTDPHETGNTQPGGTQSGDPPPTDSGPPQSGPPGDPGGDGASDPSIGGSGYVPFGGPRNGPDPGTDTPTDPPTDPPTEPPVITTAEPVSVVLLGSAILVVVVVFRRRFVASV